GLSSGEKAPTGPSAASRSNNAARPASPDAPCLQSNGRSSPWSAPLSRRPHRPTWQCSPLPASVPRRHRAVSAWSANWSELFSFCIPTGWYQFSALPFHSSSPAPARDRARSGIGSGRAADLEGQALDAAVHVGVLAQVEQHAAADVEVRTAGLTEDAQPAATV